jgi:small conductance mechanosensitive channel
MTEFISQFLQPQYWAQVFSPDRLALWLTSIIRVGIIFASAWIAILIIKRFVPALKQLIATAIMRGDGVERIEMEKRVETLSKLFRTTVSILIWGLAVVMSLKQLGFDIAPLLAGAGVLGLAISFGARNLVADVMTGVIMLLENQIRVNDVVQINGQGGLVEDISLRTIRLRGLDGTVHIFPNGGITSTANLTREFSYYLFNLGVAYKEDTDRVIEVVRAIADEMMVEELYREAILEPLDVLGVDSFGDSSVVIKMRIKTQPIRQWMVGREMNRRIKKKFDEVGIEIPFPQRTLHFRGDLPVEMDGELQSNTSMQFPDRAMLKQILREVLQEMQVDPKDLADAPEKPRQPDRSQLEDRDNMQMPPGDG